MARLNLESAKERWGKLKLREWDIRFSMDEWSAHAGRTAQRKALRDRYGFGPEHTAFLDAFAALPSFEDTAVAIVQDGLDRGVEPRAIRRTTRLFQAYEKMFWDAMMAPGAQKASG